MEIIYASPADAAALAALEAICLPSDPWGERAMADAIADPDCPTILAREGETVIGYVTGRALPPESELYRIVTHPSHRTRGIARTLALAFCDALRAAGCDTCFLEVRASNTPARALYRSLGFTACGTRRNYYRNPTEDAILKVWKF